MTTTQTYTIEVVEESELDATNCPDCGAGNVFDETCEDCKNLAEMIKRNYPTQ